MSREKSGGDSEKVTPVPIPNTEVKLLSADGSWGFSPCESRTSPGVIYGGLAQLGEHLPYKQRVGGSIPSSSTIIIGQTIICRFSSIGRATDL
jgi:hypothetical protein